MDRGYGFQAHPLNSKKTGHGPRGHSRRYARTSMIGSPDSLQFYAVSPSDRVQVCPRDGHLRRAPVAARSVSGTTARWHLLDSWISIYPATAIWMFHHWLLGLFISTSFGHSCFDIHVFLGLFPAKLLTCNHYWQVNHCHFAQDLVASGSIHVFIRIC